MRLNNNLVLCLALLIPAGAAAKGPLDLSAKIGYFGSYMWRGMTIAYTPVLQPELSANLAGFGLSVWGNMNVDDTDGASGFDEFDFTLSYSVDMPMASVDLGFVVYTLPDASELNTSEVYASASAAVLLSPTLTVYRDLDLVDGWYWEAGISHELPLLPAAIVEVAATLGAGSDRYMQGYFPTALSMTREENTTASTLTDLAFILAVPWQPTPLATVTPSVTWSTLLGVASLSVEDVGGDGNTLVWAVSAAVSF